MAQLELTLAASPTAPGAARQAVRAWFHSRHYGDEAAETAELLVTELVSNAVAHANGSSLWLTVDETMTDVHVAVRDSSQAVPRHSPRVPEVHRTGGLGLCMVDALASSWGWELLRTGKRVWFELPAATMSPS